MSNLNHYDDNTTVEWLNDVKYISPSSHPNHAIICGELLNNFYNYLKGKPVRLFAGRTDLCLFNPYEPINITDLKKPVVPDLFVVSDNKFEIVGNSIVCIPDFLCEVVSTNSFKLDNNIKKELYLSRGVKEYWVVNYLDKSIKVYFDNKENVFSFEDEVKVNIFKDLTICLKDVELFEL